MFLNNWRFVGLFFTFWILLCVSDQCSDAIREWAGYALAHPEFVNSVNTIPTRWGRLCPPYCFPTRIWKPNGISAMGCSNLDEIMQNYIQWELYTPSLQNRAALICLLILDLWEKQLADMYFHFSKFWNFPKLPSIKAD